MTSLSLSTWREKSDWASSRAGAHGFWTPSWESFFIGRKVNGTPHNRWSPSWQMFVTSWKQVSVLLPDSLTRQMCCTLALGHWSWYICSTLLLEFKITHGQVDNFNLSRCWNAGWWIARWALGGRAEGRTALVGRTNQTPTTEPRCPPVEEKTGLMANAQQNQWRICDLLANCGLVPRFFCQIFLVYLSSKPFAILQILYPVNLQRLLVWWYEVIAQKKLMWGRGSLGRTLIPTQWRVGGSSLRTHNKFVLILEYFKVYLNPTKRGKQY